MTAAVAPQIQPGARSSRLPRLREDLRLIDQAPDAAARERLVYDPLRHRYIRIDAASMDLLSLWHTHDDAQSLAAAAQARFAREIDERQVEALAAFLQQSELTVSSASGQQAWQRRQGQRHHWLMRIVHSYLFFRVPLLSPERFLSRTLPWVRGFANRGVLVIVGLLGMIGLYLVSRQWEAFIGTFRDVFTPQGALLVGLTVVMVKALHECGHAYAATHFRCRVPTMGIAFMVMVPMLYTDVTDAWRLADRRSRLIIDAAGVAVEIGLACIALFVWSFLPEGASRTAAFMVASTSLVMTLGLNLSPFMRFDGYYMLADLWRVENLQPRAFALGRWRVRRLLFAADEPCPEALGAHKRRLLIGYAWATWIYRLVTFTGIALLVYHMFFKALGIVLFLVEIAFFIALPIVREARHWWRQRSRLLATRRTAYSAAVLLAILAAVLVPWSTRIDIPAVIEWRETVRLYPPRAGLISAVHTAQAQSVVAADAIVSLVAPELAAQARQAETRLRVTELRLARRMADDQDREQSLVLEDEKRALLSKLSGLEDERGLLTVRAPVSGALLEINPALHPGRWISKTEPVALVGQPTGLVVRGYIDEAELPRAAVGSKGRFIAHESLLPAIDVELTEIARVGAVTIDLPELTSVLGGPIAVEEDRTHRMVPTTARYAVSLAPVGWPPEIARVVRGTVVLKGEPESIAARMARRVLAVLLRESGF